MTTNNGNHSITSVSKFPTPASPITSFNMDFHSDLDPHCELYFIYYLIHVLFLCLTSLFAQLNSMAHVHNHSLLYTFNFLFPLLLYHTLRAKPHLCLILTLHLSQLAPIKLSMTRGKQSYTIGYAASYNTVLSFTIYYTALSVNIANVFLSLQISRSSYNNHSPLIILLPTLLTI